MVPRNRHSTPTAPPAPCDGIDCGNHGSCHFSSTRNVRTGATVRYPGYCTCTKGYTGERCQECSTSPCCQTECSSESNDAGYETGVPVGFDEVPVGSGRQNGGTGPCCASSCGSGPGCNCGHACMTCDYGCEHCASDDCRLTSSVFSTCPRWALLYMYWWLCW